jgi:DNA-binding FadR family transcriptional regulator
MAAQRTGSNGYDPSLSRVAREVRVPKTAELVASHLRGQIVRGELKEGDALPPETILMEQFHVSRPTLREAFRVLESEALITVRRGSHGGARVHVPNGDVAARYAGFVLQFRDTTIADVLEARAVIEPPCAGILALRRSAADLRKLKAAADEADAAIDDPNLSIRLQQDFHSLVVDLAGNETVKVLVGMLRHIIDAATYSRVTRDAGIPSERAAQHAGHRSHRRLLDYIEAKDAEAAERLWRKHIVETTAWLMSTPTAAKVVELIS